jgi:hypothetical protein
VAREQEELRQGDVIADAVGVPELAAPLRDSDGIRYHVALPKLFLLTGHVFLYPWDYVGALPQTAEMLDLLLLPFTGGEGAKLLHAAFFLATLATIVLIVHRGRPTRRPALLAAFLFAASPVVLIPVPTGFIEEIALFFVAVTALLVVRRSRPLGAGIAIAATLMTKLTAAPAAAGLGLVALARARRGERLRTFAALAVPSLIAFAPLAARNVARTGDPFFPVGLALLHRPIPGVSADALKQTTHYHGSSRVPLGIHFWLEEGKVGPDEVAGLHHLVGRKVRDGNGAIVGRIHELCVEIELHEHGNDYVVREFRIGSLGALEFLGSSDFVRELLHTLRIAKVDARVVPWDQLDLTDPARPVWRFPGQASSTST